MKVLDVHAEYTSLWRMTRPSVATVYLPIWHGDVRQFIAARTTRAVPHERVGSLFTGVLVPGLL